MSERDHSTPPDGPLDFHCDVSDLKPHQVSKKREKYGEYFLKDGKLQTAAGQAIAFDLDTTDREEVKWKYDYNVSIATTACKECAEINACRPKDSPPFICLVQANPPLGSVRPDGTVTCALCRIAHQACAARGGKLPLGYDDANRKPRPRQRKSQESDSSSSSDDDSSSLSENFTTNETDESIDDQQSVTSSNTRKRKREATEQGDTSMQRSISTPTPIPSRIESPIAIDARKPSTFQVSRPGVDTLPYRRKTNSISVMNHQEVPLRRYADTNRQSERQEEENSAILVSSEDEVPLSQVRVKAKAESSTGEATSSRGRLPGPSSRPIVVPRQVIEHMNKLKDEKKALKVEKSELQRSLSQGKIDIEEANKKFLEKAKENEALKNELAFATNLLNELQSRQDPDRTRIDHEGPMLEEKMDVDDLFRGQGALLIAFKKENEMQSNTIKEMISVHDTIVKTLRDKERTIQQSKVASWNGSNSDENTIDGMRFKIGKMKNELEQNEIRYSKMLRDELERYSKAPQA